MMMIDTTTLEQKALNEDGCYMVDVSNGSDAQIKSVFLDGVKQDCVQFCDVNRGLLIKAKHGLSGKPFIVNDDFVYEIVFGAVVVEFK